MKTLQITTVAFIIATIIFAGCAGNTGKPAKNAADIVNAEPDTGYTGIKQFTNKGRISKEETFKNGVKEGITKTFYLSGQIRQSFWYEKGLKQDSAKWFYPEGQLFRSTPFKNDTIDGIQIQYYRNGTIKAKMGYEKGLRTLFFEEYNKKDGKLYKDYPEIVTTIKDQYKTNGTYKITLSLSDNSTRVEFYKGEMTAGRFDTAHLKKLTVNKEGKATLLLKKTGSATSTSTGVIALIQTPFNNKKISCKTIKLPYNDLK